MAISADGHVATGFGNVPSGQEAFRWTAQNGIESLGQPARVGMGASMDGSVIVGWAGFASGDGAFRWIEGMGIEQLSIPLTGAQAESVSGDGSVVVGVGQTQPEGYARAWRWDSEAGYQSLGVLPGGLYSQALDVSADGSIVVGDSDTSGPGPPSAYRWTSETGMQALPMNDASAVSGDGTVIVGAWYDPSGHTAASMWTLSGGLQLLADPSTSSVARDVAWDGSIVVGEMFLPELVETAFIWDSSNGIRELGTVLAQDFDLDVSGWHLTRATGISADGSTIVGYGVNSNAGGAVEAWVAVIPEPSTLVLLTAGLILLSREWGLVRPMR